VATVRAMADRIEGEGLGEAFAMKPMLNGSELAELKGVKGGPEVGVITARLIQAQLHNPTLTSQDAELINWERKKESLFLFVCSGWSCLF
jgi:hypothetical protein